MSGVEIFDIIDDATGSVVGTAPRSRCHGDPSLLHRSVHVAVFSPDGDLLLQKRKITKDIQPGKWDSAAGGHLAHGETYEAAAVREMSEELGVVPAPGSLKVLFDYKVRNEIESENVRVFSCVNAGPFHPQESELDEVRFFSPDDLRERLKKGDTADLTPLLCREIALLFPEK